MPEMHLKQTGFTYNACGPFTKKIERIRKCKETGDLRYIFRNELDKACFEHGKAYGDFKNLPKRTASNKYYVVKHLILLKIKEVFFQWFTDCLIKIPLVVLLKVKIYETKN